MLSLHRRTLQTSAKPLAGFAAPSRREASSYRAFWTDSMSYRSACSSVFLYSVPLTAPIGWVDEVQFKASLEKWRPENRQAVWASYTAFRDSAMEATLNLGCHIVLEDGPWIVGYPAFNFENTSLFLVAWQQDREFRLVASPVQLSRMTSVLSEVAKYRLSSRPLCTARSR